MSKYTFAKLSSLDDLSDWDVFVEKSPQGTLFCRSWWLREVFGDSFEIIVSIYNGQIIMGIPLPYVVSGSKKSIIRPPMTTTMGILSITDHLAIPDYQKLLSSQIEVMSGLVERIPPVERFCASFHPSFTNWLPFYWKNYQQTTCYTYVLDNIDNIDELVRGFHHSKRKNLARAKSLVQVEKNMTIKAFYSHHKMTLKKEGKTISYGYDYLLRVFEATKLHAQAEILSAVDNSGVIHSAIIILYDKVSAYYIASSIDPEYRNSGSTTLLLVEAIKIASAFTSRFDFEGSMLPGVENSFRRLGAKQVPYFVVYKNGGLKPMLRLLLERTARKMGIKE